MHETIYTALLALYERGEPLDKITLSEELKRRGQLDKIGGLAYLTSLMDTVPTAASAEYYANIVREKSSLRGLIHAGTQITRIGYEGEEDVEGSLGPQRADRLRSRHAGRCTANSRRFRRCSSRSSTISTSSSASAATAPELPPAFATSTNIRPGFSPAT